MALSAENAKSKAVTVRCYGATTRSLAAALNRVANAGVFKTSFALFFDDGKIATAHQALSDMLRDIEEVALDGPLLHYPTYRNPAVDLSLIAAARSLQCQPLDLREICTVLGQGASVTREDIRDCFLAISKLMAEELGYSKMHTTAAKRLWQDTLEIERAKLPVSLNAVVIDNDKQFRELAGRKLDAVFDNVKLCSSMDEYNEECKREASIRPESVELFLLDIVAPEGDTDAKTLFLTGFEEALPQLIRLRGLQPLPQIIMLSRLPAETIAHLCYQAGADYYVEKSEFQTRADFKSWLRAWFSHALRGRLRVRSLADTEVIRKEIVLAWKEKLGGTHEDASRTARLVYALFEKRFVLSKVDLIGRLAGGKSGACTLLVMPYLKQEQKPVPMAPRVVKIDSPEKMAKEWEAYHKYISALAPQSFARIEPFFYRDAQNAAISYNLAGTVEQNALGEVQQVLSLFSEPFDFENLCQRVFSLLEPLHKMEVGRRARFDLLRYMTAQLAPIRTSARCTLRRLGEGVKYRIERVEKDKQRLDIYVSPISSREFRRFAIYLRECPETDWCLRPGKVVNVSGLRPEEYPSLAEPLPRIKSAWRAWNAQNSGGPDNEKLQKRRQALAGYFQQKWNEVSARIDRILEEMGSCDWLDVVWGMVHGDLNLRNILHAKSQHREDYWLIDFARTSMGPPAVDYVTFEFEVRFQVLRPLLHKMLLPLRSEATHDIDAAQDWFEKAKSIIAAYEHTFQCNNSPMDVEEMSKGITENERHMLTNACTAIAMCREIALKGLYNDETGRYTYDLVFLLFALKTTQKYEDEMCDKEGPLGTLWGLMALEQALENWKQ